jgi:hypothetical protein
MSAGGGFSMFDLVAKTEDVLPGDLLVYGSVYKNGERTPGHVGLITAVKTGFKRGAEDWHLFVRVAHSTPKHRTKYGNCVAVTDARIWRKKGYIVRYRNFVAE